jgi:hypothetical protein
LLPLALTLDRSTCATEHRLGEQIVLIADRAGIPIAIGFGRAQPVHVADDIAGRPEQIAIDGSRADRLLSGFAQMRAHLRQGKLGVADRHEDGCLMRVGRSNEILARLHRPALIRLFCIDRDVTQVV